MYQMDHDSLNHQNGYALGSAQWAQIKVRFHALSGKDLKCFLNLLLDGQCLLDTIQLSRELWPMALVALSAINCCSIRQLTNAVSSVVYMFNSLLTTKLFRLLLLRSQGIFNLGDSKESS